MLDPVFLGGVAAVMGLGAAKYADDNWQLCDTPHKRYYSALQRHLNAFAQGQHADPESGESHLYHAACCVMFLAWFERNGKL